MPAQICLFEQLLFLVFDFDFHLMILFSHCLLLNFVQLPFLFNQLSLKIILRFQLVKLLPLLFHYQILRMMKLLNKIILHLYLSFADLVCCAFHPVSEGGFLFVHGNLSYF